MVDGIQELVNVLQKTDIEDPSKTYSAEVSSIDNEGRIWVYLEGSNRETPTAMTSAEVSVGDYVNVEWRNNKLFISGNVSNPSAGTARVYAVEQAAQVANQAAANAVSDASIARSAAESAVADASRAQTSADQAEASAQQAVEDAATANTAANNAGRAAAIAQAAAEAAQGDIDEQKTYFWHDTEGAHVLGDTYRTDVKDGLEVVRNSDGAVLADINPDGATFKSGNGTQIAHLGYGETQGASGQTRNSPYFDIGVRQANTNIGSYSVAEGYSTRAEGSTSHAEGDGSAAFGENSHAEGNNARARGKTSHAEGYYTETTADAEASHAEGYNTKAKGIASHAEGIDTEALGNYQHVQGNFNVPSANFADIVGNGTEERKSNAFALDWQGNGFYKKDVFVGCNADSSGGEKLAKVSDIPDIPDIDTSTGSLKIGNVLIEWGTFLMTEASRVGTGTNPYTYSYDINFSESFSSAPAISFTFRGNYTNVTRIIAYSSTVDKVVAYVHRTAQATTGSVCWIAIGNI